MNQSISLITDAIAERPNPKTAARKKGSLITLQPVG
jgi:hypothetical protein